MASQFVLDQIEVLQPYKLYNYILQKQMGNQQSVIAQRGITTQQLKQFQASVEDNIKQGRLQWDHQLNIYSKTEYLLSRFELKYKDRIQEIKLGWNMISDKMMQLLTKFDFNQLKVLNLEHNQINCQALENIKYMKLIHLTTLYLNDNKIAQDGCFYLMRAKLPSLQTLDISGNEINDASTRNLAKGNWPNLRTLIICNNKFTEKGLEILGRGQWQLLAYIKAKNNNYTSLKNLDQTKFRSQVKGFRIEIQ